MPGDKSIAHRWLILAGIADGRSAIRELPEALDVKATARVLSRILSPEAGSGLDGWASKPAPSAHGDRSTGNDPRPPVPPSLDARSSIEVEGRGRGALHPPERPLDCANSGTTMRLLSGVLASAPFESVLEGDASLSRRPMERVAEPLRRMGADVRTNGGRPPMVVRGAPLRGIEHVSEVPSAQVKSAVLLAGLAAEGETTVIEPAATRDHTERALRHLGAPIRTAHRRVSLRAYQHEGFEASVPGDISSAAFLVAAAALTGRALVVEGVGLNPTRSHVLEVLERMGVRVHLEQLEVELGEPVGRLEVESCEGLAGTTVEAYELPLVIDEVPVLGLLAAHASGESRFAGARELREKESDRLNGVVEVIRALGGAAGVEGDDLVVAGGGLQGGPADARGDHRMAMAIAVSALAARTPTAIEGIESAEISFPGFLPTLVALGARVE
ncbi:MAG: 3-phosphoshikimate 1-carboxyvinyltransferase [Actinobacteria bacterium]|nr:3-phosphoshikimate 1-carboxyvinyltransferase [Actinomycetota bacterium]